MPCADDRSWMRMITLQEGGLTHDYIERGKRKGTRNGENLETGGDINVKLIDERVKKLVEKNAVAQITLNKSSSSGLLSGFRRCFKDSRSGNFAN